MELHQQVRRTTSWILSPLLAAAVCGTGCGDEASTETASTASVRVSATSTSGVQTQDAGAAAAFSSVVVSVSEVYLVPAGEEDTKVQLMNEEPFIVDLMHLGEGLSAVMTETTVPAGRYSQLRIVVDEATVTLAHGLTFEDGKSVRALKIPSGAQTGIKVNTLGAVEANPGSWSSLLVDFDVAGNFVVQGYPDAPAGIKDVLFKPVLKEVSRTSLPQDEEA